MKFRSKLALATLVCFALLSTTAAYGAVIEEVVIFGDFDNNGNIIPCDVFTPADDIVGIWFNLSDVSPGDNIIIEWWPPSGELYKVHNWTAPSWVQYNSDWDMWEDIEIMGDPAENMPGVWAADITVNGTWYGHAVFEIVDESTPSGPGTPEDVPSNVMAITDLQTPGTYNSGENVSVSVTLEYNFDQSTDIAPSVWNNKTQTFVATVEDTVSGVGSKTYDLEFVADEKGTDYYLVAYYVDGQDIVYTDEVGIVAFKLEDTDVGTGIEIPSLEDLGLPTDIDIDEIKNQITDYVGQLRDLIPDDLSDIEDEVRERTGIPGFPLEALVLGASALVYALRRRD